MILREKEKERQKTTTRVHSKISMPGGNVFGCIENGSCFGLVNSKK